MAAADLFLFATLALSNLALLAYVRRRRDRLPVARMTRSLRAAMVLQAG